MRRVIGYILAGLAGFLLCTAVLLMVYAPGKAKVTPLNIDSTTKLSGTARALPDGSSGPIKAVARTVVDSAASDSQVAVFDQFTCLMKGSDGPDCVDDKDKQKRLISATTSRVAGDRGTAMAVNDEKYTEQSGTPVEGLVVKFPFDVEKKTYPYWDGTVGKAVDATFQGEEDLEGLTAYKFVVDIPETKVEIAKGIMGTYKDRKEIWVDPATGGPVKQAEQQVRMLDGKPILDIDLAFTADQVSSSVKDAKANGSQLALIGKGPWFAGILGLLAALAAAFALMGARRNPEDADAADDVDYPGAHAADSSGEATAAENRSLLDGFSDEAPRQRRNPNQG